MNGSRWGPKAGVEALHKRDFGTAVSGAIQGGSTKVAAIRGGTGTQPTTIKGENRRYLLKEENLML
jgi:hypothetical protein